MRLLLLFTIIAMVAQPALAQFPQETHSGQIDLEPIRIRPWLDLDSALQLRHGKLPVPLSSAAPVLPAKRPGAFIDLGKPVNQFAFSRDGESVFALLEDRQTLIHLSGESPPKIIQRYQLSAPSESIVVIRGFLVILQQQIGRLEFRPLSNLNKALHWEASEGSQICGVGLSFEEERAPLIVWTRDLTKRREVHYDFEFLDSKTLKASPWKLVRTEEKNNFTIPSSTENQWNGKLSLLEASSDGLTAETALFKLSFLAGHQVNLSFNPEYKPLRTDHTKFRGKKLPYGLLASKIQGISETCLFVAIYGDEKSEVVAVLDKESLTPVCILEGFPGKLGDIKESQVHLWKKPFRISFNERGNQILFFRGISGKIATYQFNLQKTRNEIPAQFCPAIIPLKIDEAGRMNIEFCPNWEGDGHHFRLAENSPGVTLNPKTGTALLTVPVNQTPGSTITILAEGQHRTGPKIALTCTVEVPPQ